MNLVSSVIVPTSLVTISRSQENHSIGILGPHVIPNLGNKMGKIPTLLTTLRNMGIYPHFIPSFGNNMGKYFHIIPKFEDCIGIIISYFIPNIENNLGRYPHFIPNFENYMAIHYSSFPILTLHGNISPYYSQL